MRILAVLTLLLLVLSVGATAGFYRAANLRINQIQQARGTNQHVHEATVQIKQAESQLALLEGKQDELKKRLPTFNDINQFFAYVTGLASQHRVTHSFTFPQSGAAAPAGQKNSVSDVTLTITISGSDVEAITNFLYDLEHGPYSLTIKQATIDKAKDATEARGTVEFILYVNKTS